MESQGRQVDHHNSKGRQLTQEARCLPQFDTSLVADDLDKVNKTWNNSTKVRTTGKGEDTKRQDDQKVFQLF